MVSTLAGALGKFTLQSPSANFSSWVFFFSWQSRTELWGLHL
jgi:hypothetical protein